MTKIIPYTQPLLALYLLLLLLLSLPATAQDFKVEKLPDFINSPYDEITPVPSRDGQTLYFTRVAYPEFNQTLILDTVNWAQKLKPVEFNKFLAEVYSEIAGYRVVNPAASPFNQDVWMALGDTAAFYSTQHPGPPLNNALPNSMVSITPDPHAFIIINQFSPKGDMNKGFSLIRQDSAGWAFPDSILIEDYYTITSDVSLTMSFDGEVIILSAVRFDSRDMDLYACFREGRRRWSKPLHLGRQINSPRRETTPFLSEDHQTLFFSSNRGESSGGNDIFMSKRLDSTWTNWSEPQRLTEPINSKSDESQPYFNMTTGYLYFCSRREGNSNIYRVRIAPPQPTELEVRGRVLNRRTREIVPGARVRYGAKGSTINVLTTSDGAFSLKIPKGVAFNLVAEKSGFAGEPLDVLYRRDYYYFREQYVELLLDPLEINAKIELQPIFFQQSKALILERSFGELERLANMLLETPGLHVKIEGHTDNVGRPEDLQALSEARANAIRNFLLEKGVGPERIEAKGMGPQFPLNDNSSDALRAQNRRVEVTVTKL